MRLNRKFIEAGLPQARLLARTFFAVCTLLLAASGAQAAVAFRSATSASQATGASITVNKPAGTTIGDVLLASIAVVSNASTVTAPVGWTSVLSTNQNNTESSRLYTFYRIALPGEPANYSFTISGVNIGAVVAMASFSGVDISASPIDASGSATSPKGNTHTAPSVTTTMAGDMLVTVHEYASSRTWTPPAGMTERVDRSSFNKSLDGVSLEMNTEPRAAIGATGPRVATAGGNADRGASHSIALKATPLVPGAFNVYDTGTTPAAAIVGVIKTKVAALAFTLDIAALNTAKTGLLTTFTGAVKVELLNASDNTGALDVNACRTSWTTIQTLSPNPTFTTANNGRLTTASITESGVYPEVRVRVTFPATGPSSKIGCSTDNFAIRPARFTGLSISDSDALTAGTTRSLSNSSATGGVVHKAGRPFQIGAVVENAVGPVAFGTTAGRYNGLPTGTITCLLPATCTLGILDELGVSTAWTAGASTGSFYSASASYDDAGSFTMQLIDSTFAAVDGGDGTPADCSALGQYVCSNTTPNVGRFVPDHFELVDASATDPLVDPLVDTWLPLPSPQFLTFNVADASCNAAATAPIRSFTYIGQAFGYVNAPPVRVPQATYKAMNATNTPMVNYRDELMKLTPAGITQTYSATTGTLDTSLALGTPTLTPNVNYTNGLLSPIVGTIAVNTADRLAFVRNLPTAQFNAAIQLSMTARDSSENGVAGNGNIDTTPPVIFNGTGTGISFDSGVVMRFGRLKLANAFGSELLDLPIPIETQFWNGNIFAINAADHCTVINTNNIALGNYKNGITAANMGAPAHVTVGGAFLAGRGSLKLTKPAPAGSGSVDIAINLGATGADQPCTAVAAATTGAIIPYLRGRWCGASNDRDPSARATFGIYKNSNQFIYMREMY